MYSTERMNEIERNLELEIRYSLLISYSWVKSSSYLMKFAYGGQNMVQDNECSSYPRFDLTNDFYKEVLTNVQRTGEKRSRYKSSS